MNNPIIFFGSGNTLVVSGYIPNGVSMVWSTSSLTLGSFGGSGVPVSRVQNYAPGVSTLDTSPSDLLSFTVQNVPPGFYEVTIQLAAYRNTTANYGSIAITDGSNTRGHVILDVGNTLELPVTIIGHFKYSAFGDRTFEVLGSTASSAIVVDNSYTEGDVQFSLKRLA